ncbi:bifunctional hydroxymethylpyrimidine kinase/phosphomethylpyrimidine kinase [Rhabdaerophilum calidifontis]|uniref:bifunctional hydroxymethylpyrimidine kinase/phosphomethylpyrimidine kinase n=1 Tax=Rhabdaerophilum calidifontis TaxID=2604328 RepID=UPI00123A26B8|nr:bifunctional hydroxymethylpyrimidine kinase/phosphomethylpyrimidine kinase [Rhabdaerophilum calidifontis]
MTAIALTIAGSDSGGGAGIQADLKTFSALGVYGASVITALTAQNTRGVQGIHDVPADFVAAQMASVLGDLAVDAVKIGMLSVPATIEAVAAGLAAYSGPVVLDPVMVAASGDPLLTEAAIGTLVARLLPRADVLTPNLPEAARLLGEPIATDEAAMAAQGRALLARGPKAVLVKGGHGTGPEALDLLVTPAGITRLAAPRIPSRNSHGTGCTLSSAIAAGLAKGMPLPEAVQAAKTYTHAAIAAADRLRIGHGHGPTHHFHAWW